MSKHAPKIKTPDANEVERYGGSSQRNETEKPSVDAQPGLEPGAADKDQGEGTDEAAAGARDEQLDEAAQLHKQIEELTDKHLRAVAELQNFRRRAAVERSEAVRYASVDLVRLLLPVVDDLERSLAAAESDESASLVGGVKLVHQNLLKALATAHVERIESVGKPFDPALHEAMMQRPSEEHPPDTVLEEYQAGYTLWDRVLRPAKVIVSKADAEQDDQEGQERTTD